MLETTFKTGPAVEWTPLYGSFRITPCSLQKCNKMQQLTRIPRRIKTHKDAVHVSAILSV